MFVLVSGVTHPVRSVFLWADISPSYWLSLKNFFPEYQNFELCFFIFLKIERLKKKKSTRESEAELFVDQISMVQD